MEARWAKYQSRNKLLVYFGRGALSVLGDIIREVRYKITITILYNYNNTLY